MTVKYTIVARGNPQNLDAPKKYYPVAKSTGETTLPKLAERMAEMSTLSSADLAAALEALLTIILREIAAGNIVRLGDFGSFSLRVRSEGSESEEAVSARNITKTIASFRPGKRFQRVVDEIKFEKA